MGEMENQAEFYYEKLKVSINPGRDLLDFFREMTGKEFGIIMINRLIKIFGRFTVYFSIMDLSKYTSEKLEGNLYPLLYTICKARFERIHNDSFNPAYESLDRLIKKLDDEREKAKKSKGKVPTSEGL
jgi:hypothetical protein